MGRGSAGASSSKGFRSEVRRLQRELFNANQKRIDRAVVGYSQDFRRYERRYRHSVPKAKASARWADLYQASRRNQVVLFGDYHTLALAQRAFLRLLLGQPQRQPLIIALEMFKASHQSSVDRFLDGHIGERTFLRRVRYQESWPFCPFERLRPIFDLARARGWRIIGIDRARRSLDERDVFAAQRIVRALRAEPRARVFALIGDMHLAPSHLPRKIRAAASESGSSPSVLRIHQNPDPVWFAWERGQQLDPTEVLELADDTFALFTASPLLCQQSYLAWLEEDAEGGGFSPEAQGSFSRLVRQAVRAVAKAFDLPSREALSGLEVAGAEDLAFFARLRRSRLFDRQELQKIRSYILGSESCYLPRTKTIYLAEPSLSHAGEEAAHLLRHVLSGEPLDDSRGLVDAFYSRVMHEALGFLGGKILNPRRRAPDERELEGLLRQKKRHAAAKIQAAKLALLHRAIERGERTPPLGLSKIYGARAELFNSVTHLLGYMLGDRLFSGLVRRKIGRSEVRALFYEPFDLEGSALLVYFELTGKLAQRSASKTLSAANARRARGASGSQPGRLRSDPGWP